MARNLILTLLEQQKKKIIQLSGELSELTINP